MLSRYKSDISFAKSEINSIFKSDDQDLNSVIDNYFSTGGKGVRLILALIFSRIGNYQKNKKILLRNAALVELIHTTSLIHDDIIDGAELRRNRATLNNIHGNKRALFIGDYLFASVLKEAATIDNVEFHKYLSITLKELCRGEIIQNGDLYNINTRRLDYLKKIKRKTAILIAFACVSAAILSEASQEDISNSYKFGYYLGMSYQIRDDFLDFIADESNLGKDIGQDLVNGNITLPIIIKIEKDRDKFLNYKELTKKEKMLLVEEIKNDRDISNRLQSISQNYMNKALYSIKNFPEEIQRELHYIVEVLENRSK